MNNRIRTYVTRSALILKTIAVSCVVAFTAAPTLAQEFIDEANELPDVDIVESSDSKKAAQKRSVAKTKTRLTKIPGVSSKKTAPGTAGSVGGEPASVNGASVDASAPDGGSSGVFIPGGGGITGASTTVISSEQIRRAPQISLADIIAREGGVQSTSLFGGVNGARTTIDIRGFGATGSSNTLVLINGRRLNDWDLQGFNLATIPKESVERIEITRGNSGAVLYGDGAVGGVVNIVTRSGADTPQQLRVEGGIGSFNHRESSILASGASGPFSAVMSGNWIKTDGYRDNNAYEQVAGTGDFRWSFTKGSVYFTVAADDQKLGLPGERQVRLFSVPPVNQLRDDRRGTNTPFDYADQQGARATLGFTYKITPNFEVIVDGGIRNKEQQAGFFSPFQEAYVDTDVVTKSLTPRVNITEKVFGLPSRIIAGLDFYDTDYESKRSQFEGQAPIHIYDGRQKSFAGYAQQILTVLPTTDISLGGRIQRNKTTARDTLDTTARGFCPFGPPFCPLEGVPLDDSETNTAWHVGVEHELVKGVTLIARAAKSFRVPNIDERIGSAPFNVPVNFNLQTQKSRDWEVGARWQYGTFQIQSTYYDMRLTDELQFDPINFINTNLDPTRRRGVETIASWQATRNVLLRGNVTYTDAFFRSGPFVGNQVPLVSPWTAHIAATWVIIEKWLTLDAALNYVGERRMDNDQANFQPKIPSHTTVDLGLSGEIGRFYWSAAVKNVFDEEYFDYAVASSFTLGAYNAYPQPGRTFMVKAGAKW